MGLPGAALKKAQLCYNGTLDPAKVSGKIVVCDRGITARVDKSQEVLRAGGVGMLLVDTPESADDTVADVHSVPTVHLPREARDPIRAYVKAAAGAASAVLSPPSPGFDVEAPVMANWSSRGPIVAGDGNLLKVGCGGRAQHTQKTMACGSTA